jgi:transcriptional regulator with XRE-family HTH domain
VAKKSAERAFYSAFGKLLADARRKRHVSQEVLADELGLSRTSITNIEKGRQPVQLYSLYLIARLLETEIKDLLPLPSILEHPDQAESWTSSRSEWLNVVLAKEP